MEGRTSLNRTLRFQILALALTRLFINTMFRMVYPFLGVFRDNLGVSLSQLSLTMTARAVMSTVGPFIAAMADQRGRKVVVGLGLVLFAAGVSLVILLPNFLGFFLLVTLTMLSRNIFDPAMYAFIGDHVPYNRRGLVLAFTELSWSMSFVIVMPIIGLLIAGQGWLAPFPWLLLFSLAALVILARILPGGPPTQSMRSNTWLNLGTVLRSAPALAGLSVGLSFSAANEVVNLVFGVWLEDSFGVKVAALGAASLVLGLAELGGEFFVGGLTDRLGKVRSLALGLMLNCVVVLALPILGRTLIGAVIGLFFFYLTFEFTIVSNLPLMTEVLPAARATLMAASYASMSIGRAMGAALASPLYSQGILASGIATVAFNLLALLALRCVRLAFGANR